MLMRVWIERIDPLSGTAATEGGTPLRFDGWLELLRVVSELVAPASSGGENAGTYDGTGRPGTSGDRERWTMRIGLTSIYVDDQDKAERFYTDVLGLVVKTSAAYGPGERWLSVASPEDPDGVELVLHLADDPARAFQQASREAGR